jgi:hypothetical protein
MQKDLVLLQTNVLLVEISRNYVQMQTAIIAMNAAFNRSTRKKWHAGYQKMSCYLVKYPRGATNHHFGFNV